MISEKQIKTSANEDAAKLLSILIDADRQTEQQISNYMQQGGIAKFFSRLDSLGFSVDIVERLKSVKAVLDATKGGEIHS